MTQPVTPVQMHATQVGRRRGFTSYVVVRIDPDGVAPLMELGTAKFAGSN
jgi:hypothetical protein